MTERHDPRRDLHILAPRDMKPKFDRMHRDVQRAAGGMRLTRREALGLAGLAILGAACGTTSTNPGAAGTSSQPAATGSTTPPDPLAGKPLEDKLEIYNWSQYDDPSTYKLFVAQADEAAAGTKVHETYYASNDELLAKLNAGAGGY